MKKVVCLLADGFEETEALQTVDILRRANIHVDLIAIDQIQVTGSHHIKVIADGLLDSDLMEYDMLFLPGGQPGTNHLMADERVIEAVKKFNDSKKWLAAICAAPLVLDKAGVLEGKKVTSYPSVAKDAFKKSTYLQKEVVLDGNIITSRGVGTVPAFAFTIVEMFGIDSQPLKDAMVFGNHR